MTPNPVVAAVELALSDIKTLCLGRRDAALRVRSALAAVEEQEAVEEGKARDHIEPVPKSASQGRDEVVEMCAKVADEKAAETSEDVRRYQEAGSNLSSAGVWVAHDIANRIRSLKHDVPDGQGAT